MQHFGCAAFPINLRALIIDRPAESRSTGRDITVARAGSVRTYPECVQAPISQPEAKSHRLARERGKILGAPPSHLLHGAVGPDGQARGRGKWRNHVAALIERLYTKLARFARDIHEQAPASET